MSRAGNEHSLRRKVSLWLTKEQQDGRLWYVKFTPSRFTRAGVPDYLICKDGRFIAVELKTESGKVSEIQKREHVSIAKAGGVIIVVTSLASFKELLSCY